MVRFLLAACALALGLWGIRWGLPSQERLARILAPGFETQASLQELSDSWTQMHQRLGSNLMLNPDAGASFTGIQSVEPGWTAAPALLVNSIRSFHVRSAHEDEQSYLLALSRMRPGRLQLNPHFFTYGGAHLYVLGAWLALAAEVGRISLHSSLLPYLQAPAKMASLYLAGRLLSVLAFVGCVLMLLRIGRRHLGWRTGALAGLMFALCPAAIIQAHVLKNHTVWSFLALLTLDLSADILEKGGLWNYAAAGAVSGLTVGAFLQGWPVCLIVAAACVLRLACGRGATGPQARGLAVAAVCSIGAFFLTNPYWLLASHEVLAEMNVLRGFSTVDFTHPFLFLWNPLRHSVTSPVLVLMLAGALWALRRGRREPALLLCLCAFVFGLAATSLMGNVVTTRQVRYGLVWLGVGALLASHVAVMLIQRDSRARPWLAGGLILVLANLALQGVTYSYNFHIDATPLSTHVRSGEWIESHVPAGSSIGLLRLPQPSNAPYFRYDRYAMRFIEPRLFGNLPAAQLPEFLAVVAPDYDDRPLLEPNLSRYASVVLFERAYLVPWVRIDETSTTANPLIAIYRLRHED